MRRLKIVLGINLLLWTTIIVRDNTPFVETLFVKLFYPLIYTSRAWFFDLIPFSFGDLWYTLMGMFLIYKLYHARLVDWKGLFLSLISVVSILLLWFQLSWGLNYHRTKLTQKIPGKDLYSLTELTQLATFFAHKANDLHHLLSTDEHKAISFTSSTPQIIKQIEDNYPETGIKGKVKESLYSLPLTYMGFAGYLNPFTLEAQINGRLPKINLPVTVAHEIAHQQGYAAENEANFVAFLHTFNHPNSKINYAAVLFAFKYVLNELYKADPVKATEIKCHLRLGIVENYTEISNFWKKYQNPFEPYFKQSYDTYLKANNQSKGIKSYNEVVLLLIKAFKLDQEFKIHINNL